MCEGWKPTTWLNSLRHSENSILVFVVVGDASALQMLA